MSTSPSNLKSKGSKVLWYFTINFLLNRKQINQRREGQFQVTPSHLSPDSQIIQKPKDYSCDINFKNGIGCLDLHEYLEVDHQITVNHKKIYRLFHANQLWLFDIKYGCIHGEDRHFYFLAFVDSLELSHDFTPIRCSDKNAFAESFFSIFEIDFLQVRYFP